MRALKKQTVMPIGTQPNKVIASVFSSIREVIQPRLELPKGMQYNQRLKMEGLHFLGKIPDKQISVAFLDPQYRGVLDHLNYGNEGEKRGKSRSSLPQMTDNIPKFVQEIDRVLIPSGHLFLWMDKFHLCTGFQDWLDGTSLDVVDMVTWDKGRIGMGYRTRRTGEYLIVLQKEPRKAKGVWKVHNIPDVYKEKVPNGNGVHPKPVGLQGELIEAVSNSGDVVIDPAAGSFSVLRACEKLRRNFLGCDING